VSEGRTYGFSYTYNLAGGLETVTYPSKTAAPSSGLGVRTCYDPAGRPNQVANASTGAAHASAVQYAAHGAVKQMTLGNGLVETAGYNSRLQITSLSVGSALSLTLDYGSGGNNGNLLSQTVNAGGQVFSQSYAYDNVNRVQMAAEGATWSRSFGYDAYGNMWVSGWTGPSPSSFTPTSSSWFNPSTNRLTGAGAGYDAAGNQTAIGGYSFTYDGEDRLKTSTINSATTTYSYDGEGRRVKKVSPTETRVYVYDAQGQLAAEYGPLAPVGGRQFLTADHLGSTRLVTNSTGQRLECHDYLPFGEELTINRDSCYAASASLTLKFTGKERDSESGLDYFGARYFSSQQGRFTSPDAPFADQHPDDPQSWNLYAYARNNPLTFVDDTGRGAVRAAVRAARQALEQQLLRVAREEGVRKAWAIERRILERSGPESLSMRLSGAEQRQLLARGKVEGWVGHHINSVAANSVEMARNPDNIKFVKGRQEHYWGEHAGDYTQPTSGPLIDRLAKLAGPGLLTFFAVFDERMNEYASQSAIVSKPDSFWAILNPANQVLETIAMIEALMMAEHANRQELERLENKARTLKGQTIQ
jgi:RHS repeat-associated protein